MTFEASGSKFWLFRCYPKLEWCPVYKNRKKLFDPEILPTHIRISPAKDFESDESLLGYDKLGPNSVTFKAMMSHYVTLAKSLNEILKKHKEEEIEKNKENLPFRNRPEIEQDLEEKKIKKVKFV